MSHRSRSERGSPRPAEADAESQASSAQPKPLQHSPAPGSDSSKELCPGAEQDDQMGEVAERVVMTPAQMQDLEASFSDYVAKEVPKLVEGMVTTLTEGL